ncbi:MAG: type III secretion system export apparatus subunit SctT [Alphaproteobacteria bacterium GM202ARS2]|nr:type III secretion system export apparatus subunit SctT [Alphaproteobacteria bacterium GM202ARS2]
MDALTELFVVVSPWVKALTLGSARMVGFFTFVPVLSPQWVSGSMRAAVMGALSLPIVLVLVEQFLSGGLFVGQYYGLLAIKEVAVGVLLSFVVAIIFWGVQGAGFFIDNQRGATIASSYDPLSGNQASPLAMIMLNVFIIYFIVSGGFFILLSLVYGSYAVWPIESPLPRITLEGALFVLSEVDLLVRIALLIAAPVLLAMMLSELSLALVSRFAPQLNVFNVAFSVKSGVAIFVLYIYVGVLFPYLRREFLEIERVATRIGELAQ